MALTAEDLQALSTIMERQLQPIKQHIEQMDTRLNRMDERLNRMDERLNKMDERLSEVEENTKITREAVNSLIEWADNVAVITQIKFPVSH